MELSLTQHVRASRAELWRACTVPSALAAWQADEVDGRLQQGSSVVLRWPTLGASIHLDVLEVEPEQRIVLGTGKRLRVSFDIGPGSLTITQSPLGNDEDREGFASSWRLALATLAQYLERHANHQRQTHWWVRSVPVSAQTAHVFFTDPNALGAWLARKTTGVAEEGARYQHILADGSQMSGQVRSLNPGRDVALSWEEESESLLCFRTLPSPRSNHERLVALTWSRWAQEVDPDPHALNGLGAAFERLARVLGQPAMA